MSPPLQASSQSMPWLADLVQSSEGSLDVLPVQCLCEFLLHDAADDSTGEEEEESESKEQKAKKRQVGPARPPHPAPPHPGPAAPPEPPLSLQRQQKQQQLLGRLQDLLLGPKADEQTTCEVLDYFLRRLGSSQVASRVLAIKVSPALAPPSYPLPGTTRAKGSFYPPRPPSSPVSMHRRNGSSHICQSQSPSWSGVPSPVAV